MKHLAFLLFMMCLLHSGAAQNLVLNADFEEHEICFYGINSWMEWYVTDWDITPSADYYHPCNAPGPMTVPENLSGFQHAQSGQAYTGTIIYAPPWEDENDKLHEYLIGRLSEPLQADSFYRVALFASLAEASQIACDCIEVLLTPDYPPVDSPIIFGRIDAAPQLTDAPLITDTVNWTKVCWIYRAKGGEQFLTIGNFRPNTEITDTVRLPFNTTYGIRPVWTYYYYDNVSVEKIPYHLAATGLPEHRTICPDELLRDTLHAAGFYDRFLWSTGDTTPGIVVTEPGIYTLKAWSEACQWTEELFFEAVSEPEVSLGPDTSFCPDGGSLTLKVPGSFDQYLWNTGDTLPSIITDSFGQYWVQATYACGTLYDTINISPPPKLSVMLPADTILSLGEALRIVPQLTGDVEEWMWYPTDFLDCTGCIKPYASPTHDITYQLEVRDKYGCIRHDSIHITILNAQRLYIPNAFSPNGDGVNDIFSIFGGPEVEEITQLLVFDRWGNLIYRAGPHLPATAHGWDGTRNGIPMPVGVYVWMAHVRYLDGTEARLSGEVLLAR